MIVFVYSMFHKKYIHMVVIIVLLEVFIPFALRRAKTLWSFGHSECNRDKHKRLNMFQYFTL